MQQMQDEMLAKCKFDGSYPRPVVLGLGVLVLAKDEEEYKRLTRVSLWQHGLLAVGMLAIVVFTIIAVVTA